MSNKAGREPRRLVVEVYRNLRRQVFSARSVETGRVLFHTKNLYLVDCAFHVQKGGRARFDRTGVRNVHAWVTGTVLFDPTRIRRDICWYRVEYRPTGLPYFIKKVYPLRPDHGEPIEQAGLVKFEDGRSLYAAWYPVAHARRLFLQDG